MQTRRPDWAPSRIPTNPIAGPETGRLDEAPSFRESFSDLAILIVACLLGGYLVGIVVAGL